MASHVAATTGNCSNMVCALLINNQRNRKCFISTTLNYFVNCIVCLKFHVSLSSRNIKLANCGDDRELSDISIVLYFSIMVMCLFL